MKYVITDKRLKNNSLDPKPMTPSSNGANSVDLRACMDSPLNLLVNESILINTGVKVALPENTLGMIIPRSGLGCKGVVLGNLVGNIDPDYRGEIKVCLWNRTEDVIKINPLERIAQLVVVPVINPNLWEEVTELDETKRGTNGFGSTGIS